MGIHTIAVSFIPNPDHEAVLWLEAFAETAKRKAPTLGLEPPIIETFGGLVREFHDKLAIVDSPATCTSPAITAKVIARNTAVQAVKPIVKQIRAHPSISDADLRELGLPARNGPRRQTIPPPATSPLINVIAGVDGSHKLRFADSLTPDSRRKPDGVLHMQLYMAIGGVDRELAASPRQAGFHSLVTKCPFEVHHNPADNGKMATYFGRWSTRTGLTGPWSIPVGMTITFVQRGGS